MSLFAPKLCGIEGKILFSDLDNLFLNKLDRIIQTPPPAIIKTDWNANYHLGMHSGNYFLTMGFNASLIYVDNRSPVTTEIWDHFVRYYEQARGSLYSSDAYLWRCHRDKINTYPEVAWSNGEMIIDNEYVGPIMSIAIHSNLSEGEYKINIISNKNIDKQVLDFNVTQWGNTFRLKKDFIFVTTEDVPVKKLKAIWVHIFKKSKTEKNIVLRAVTIKKLSTN